MGGGDTVKDEKQNKQNIIPIKKNSAHEIRAYKKLSHS